MKQVYFFLLIVLTSQYAVLAQCSAPKGPNLLGAKGTFSVPFITINPNAANCTSSGAATYSPTGNIGNALTGCSIVSEATTPCSDYIYTASSGGLSPEFRYTIIKTLGDANGGNCIKGDWRAREHTGDGGYFMAVNGAPNTSNSPVFYQVKAVPVCVGVTYEFSAWVMNVLPAANPGPRVGSEPNISFKVNGNVIVNSGPIAYSLNPSWVKVGGTFIATTNTVDLEVVNATAVASGNDLGLDDISINACQSNIEVLGNPALCAGTEANISFVISDQNEINNWFKIMISTNGGASFSDIFPSAQGVFQEGIMTVPFNIGTIANSMNGYKYRIMVASSENGLNFPDCLNFNEYTLTVLNECGPTPVLLTSFTASYLNGQTNLNWQTSQEINSDHFEIYRSTDGIDFYRIGIIKSAGFSDHVKDYSFNENVSQLSNYYYYRLKQVDANGKSVFYSVVRVNTGSKKSMDIYPNPVTENVIISFSSAKKSNATIQIHDNIGRLVYGRSVKVNSGNNSIAVNDIGILSKGVYYLSILNDGNVNRKKIIKL